jgi:hypothetical protein
MAEDAVGFNAPILGVGKPRAVGRSENALIGQIVAPALALDGS